MGKGEETRQSILERATALTSEVGLGGLTIGGLADALGMSKSGLFAHFKSKEALEVQVLQYVGDLFIEAVIKPALRAARGEPRLRSLFDFMLDWQKRCGMLGGCPILAAAIELDDKPGPARDMLVSQQKDWLDTLASLVRAAVAEGHFDKRIDPEQFAFELYGIQAAYHHASGLLADPSAGRRARIAFEGLIERARP